MEEWGFLLDLEICVIHVCDIYIASLIQGQESVLFPRDTYHLCLILWGWCHLHGEWCPLELCEEAALSVIL